MSESVPYGREERLALATAAVVREWAAFEVSLGLVFASLIATDQFRARIILASITNWRAKRELLLHLGKEYLHENQVKDWAMAIKTAKALGEKRNFLCHHLVSVDKKSNVTTVTDSVGDGESGFDFYKLQKFQLHNVEKWPKDIRKLSKELLSFQDHVYAEPKRWRERQADLQKA